MISNWLKASVKLSMLRGYVQHKMTRPKTHHVVKSIRGAMGLSVLMLRLQENNDVGSSMCQGDGALKSKRVDIGHLERGRSYRRNALNEACVLSSQRMPRM